MRANQTGAEGELLTTQKRPVLDRWLLIIGWLAMLIFTFHACTHMVAAGDTWVAMACGRHFVNHGVDTVEPFSANSHHAGPTEDEVANWPGWARWITDKVGLETVKKWHPTGWINQNWLTHVIFYRLSTLFGSEEDPCFNALIVWKFAIYVIAMLCVYHTARLMGVHRALAAVATGFSLYIGRSFIDVRPAGFSNVLVAVFVLVLALTSYRNALYIWLIVPIVAFWSNVHGGYLYAFIVLVPFVLWHSIMHLPKRWMVAVYSILLWVVLYGLANRFGHYDLLEPIPVRGDWLVYLLFLAIAGSLVLAWDRRATEGAVVASHVAMTIVLFLLLLPRFYVFPDNLSQQGQKMLAEYAIGARLAFVGIFLLALALGTVVVVAREKTVRVVERRTLLHVVGAGAAAFVAMVVFNPFHLTNLTHTFVISVSEHAERWRDVHEWHRALDWTNPVGTAIPFLTMYILGWLSLLGWTIALVWTARSADRPGKKRSSGAGTFPWQSTDLVLLIVGAMTVYMAIRSRRFIPIAGLAACPIIALLLQQTMTFIVAARRSKRSTDNAEPALDEAVGRAIVLASIGALVVLGLWRLLFWRWVFLPVPSNPTLVRPHMWLMVPGVILAFSAFPLSALGGRLGWWTDRKNETSPSWGEPAWWGVTSLLSLTVLGFGLWTGLVFKRVYLNYWPADPELTSIFMRMTASDAKPFAACRFIRENELNGNMFNYWTEGGFIAWGQKPDPNTGKTPLQLFMDGRAQAAYDRNIFDLWTLIMSGGPAARRAAIARRAPTSSEYREIGQWITEQLDRYGVWVVLMPNNQFDKAIVRGLDYSPDWRIVFKNNKQKLFVNVRTPPGLELYEGVFTGVTKYPDAFSENLSVGYNLLLITDTERKQEGLKRVMEAFELNPSPAPMLDLLLIASQYDELRPQVDVFVGNYAKSFEEKREQYEGHDGYNLRLEAARLALFRLEQLAKARGQTERAQACADRMDRYIAERNWISDRKRW